MKGRIAILLAVLCVGLILSACGNVPPTAAAAETTASAESQAATETSAPESAPETTATEPAPSTAAATSTAAAALPTRPDTEGESPSPYVQKMAFVGHHFVPEELFAAVDAWYEALWAQKSLDSGGGSLYDLIHNFDISEEFFREQNAAYGEDPYTEEEISDLYQLSRKAFIDKYASVWVVVKDEALYLLPHLAELTPEDWAAVGVTKEDILAQLAKADKENKELADIYRLRFGDKLD